MSPYKPLDPTELEAFDVPPQEYVVDRIAPLGSLILLDGREKSGKGLFTIDMAVSVATGESFLNQMVTQAPAAYCFAEENLREVRQRVFARLGDYRDVELYVLPLNGQTDDRFSLQSEASLVQLDEMIVKYGLKLVILDTLREFHVLAEDSSDDMGPLLRPLRQIAHNRNVAIVLNHHQNKAGTSRGSTAIRAAADQSISLNRTDTIDEAAALPETMPRGTITIDGRYALRTVFTVQLGSDMRWQVTTAPPLSADAPKRDIVLAYIRDFAIDRPITAAEISDGTLINLKTTQNLISALLKESPSPIEAFGKAAKGTPRRYALEGSFPDGWEPRNDMGTIQGAKIVPEDGSRDVGIGVGNQGIGNQAAAEDEMAGEPRQLFSPPASCIGPQICAIKGVCGRASCQVDASDQEVA